MRRRPDVVLFGAGMVASVHAAACQHLGWPVQVVGSRSLERARSLAGTVGAQAVSLEELTRTRLGDLAIVATPPARHVADAIALLDAGYQVVVEAPLSCTVAEADRLIAAEAGRSPVLYSEHLVAAPAVDGLLDRVGGLGRVTHLSARALQASPSWREGAGSDWGSDWGGGALFDLGVHPIGMVLRIAAEAGEGAPVSVSAVVTDAGSDREHATVRVHFEAGAAATVVVGWQPDAQPDWDVQVSSANGVLRAELSATPTLEHNGETVPIEHRPSGAASLVVDRGYASQLSRYWASLRTGRSVPATSRFGRAVLEVLAAAHWSAGHDATEVALPFESGHGLTPRELYEA